MTYKSESALLADIRIELGTREDVRIFRNQVGEAWIGNAVMLPSGDVLIKKPRRIKFGLCKGSSDTVGWKSIIVTAEMVGRRIAQFLAIETKIQRNVLGPAQKRFIDVVNEQGGRAGMARSLADAYRILDDHD